MHVFPQEDCSIEERHCKCIFRWYEVDTVRWQVMFFRVLLEHVARAGLQGFSGWLVFSI